MDWKLKPGAGGQRKVLQVMVAATLLAAALWVTPLLRSQAPALPRAEGAANADADARAREVPWSASGPERLPGLIGTGDEARLQQQLEIAAQDLAQREERVATREAALRADLLQGFWGRQAAAAALTFLAVALGVGWMLKRGIGWSTLRGRLQADEARLQRLQLSVIQGLQQFESTLSEARASGGGEAQGVSERAATFPAEAERAPVKWAAVGPLRSEPPVAARVEDERAAAAPAAPRAPFPAAVELPRAPRGRRIETIDEEDSWPALAPRPLGEEREAAPAAGRWAERLLSPEPRLREAGAPRSGLWSEPQRRATPPPIESRTLPSSRAQIEYLAAGGLEEVEIARRLRLSREEVRLALALEGHGETEPRRGPGF